MGLTVSFFSSQIESGQPICGNGLVEPGEECDCGYSDQCRDQCCYDANQPDNKKCKLKPYKVCRYCRCSHSALVWITFLCFRTKVRAVTVEDKFSFLIIVQWTEHSVPPVPARVLVVLLGALTRVVMRSVERSRSALTRACVMESVPSAPHLSPRPTSPPATERLKSASMG